MVKRKESETPEVEHTPSKKARKSAQQSQNQIRGSPSKPRPPKSAIADHISNGAEPDSSNEGERDSPTPRANVVTVSTPKRFGKAGTITPSRTSQADKSAKRKSALLLAETGQNGGESEWTDAVNLALSIVDNEADSHGLRDEIDAESITTPSKRGRGRPKGAKNRRSPTPEGDIPPEERYFFQTRGGPQQFSDNSFTTLGLLNHEEYIEEKRRYEDPHALELKYLFKLHSRAFAEWHFELEQGYSLCLYGWGSKRSLVDKFAEWLHNKFGSRIVVLNGFMSRVNVRGVVNTIASVLTDNQDEVKISGQIQEVLDQLLATISAQSEDLYLLMNSIDGTSLRRPSIQALFARLAAHPQVRLLATADTATFQLLWNAPVRDQFNFIFHDATTFELFDLETSPVDDVNELLGRKGQRVGGKDGIGFVLKSLPGNARNLYRILLTELLTLSMDDVDDDDEDDPERRKASSELAGIEYRTLYQKATEEFVCSSDMNFRFLLKEFHDHQMLTTTRDAAGTETISVPLSIDEIEAVLEDLVV